MIFAVDFDGTLVESAYPNIGAPKIGVIDFCKKRQKSGDIIILWTCRTGKYLEEALHFLITECDFIPDLVNENAPYDKSLYPSESRKIGADYYIDDKAISVYDIDKLTQEFDNKMENDDFLNKVDKTVATNKSMTSKQLEEYLNNMNSSVFQPVNSNLEDWKPYLGTCPHCGSANIEANYGIVLASMPPQYNCKCKDCKGTFFSGQITQESQTITPYNPDPGLPSYPNQPEKPQYDWGNTRQGWICPRCGKVNSPDRDFCDCSSNGGWGSPIIWCNSEGTSAGKPNTMPSMNISGLITNQNTATSTYNLEACNLNKNKGDLK